MNSQRDDLVVVENVAFAVEKLPVVGSAAELMSRLIALCDAHLCNKRLFLALKGRVQFMYKVFFTVRGI